MLMNFKHTISTQINLIIIITTWFSSSSLIPGHDSFNLQTNGSGLVSVHLLFFRNAAPSMANYAQKWKNG